MYLNAPLLFRWPDGGNESSKTYEHANNSRPCRNLRPPKYAFLNIGFLCVLFRQPVLYVATRHVARPGFEPGESRPATSAGLNQFCPYSRGAKRFKFGALLTSQQLQPFPTHPRGRVELGPRTIAIGWLCASTSARREASMALIDDVWVSIRDGDAFFLKSLRALNALGCAVAVVTAMLLAPK
jgi:hypothetical protein